MGKLSSGAILFAAFGAVAHAQTQQELLRDGNGGSADNVLTYGMGYHQQRYSPLKQINKSTVKRLVPVWSLSLANEVGEQAQPLVYNGVMYVTNVRPTVTIDIATGRQIWATPIEWDPAAARVVCCGLSNRGVALYDGKVFVASIDAHLKALDAKTGKQIWKTKVAEWKEGYSITSAPTVVNGVLITGMTGGEYGVRGFVAGYHPETGSLMWRRHTTAGPGEKGHETWPPGDAYLRGGGSTWITGSYDPDLDLAYWGTGNGGPWNPTLRPGDNLYTASVLAIRPKTGEIVWHFQFFPNEAYDLDGNWEMILAEIDVEGAKRRVAMQLTRGGFLYVLDRATGKLLSAKPFEKVNWATHVDMATGRPVESDISKRVRDGEQIELWPSQWGAKNWPHAAFNPETGLLYANTMHVMRYYRFVPVGEYKPGQRYQGVENLPAPLPPGEPIAYVDAIDPMTAKPKWRAPVFDIPHYSAIIATAGGLL